MSEIERGISRPPGLSIAQVHSRDALLVFCRFLNAATAVCLVLCATAFGMAIVLRSDAPHKDVFFLAGQAVRIFGILWSLSLLLVESEWRLILRAVPLLDIWAGRGIAHLFVAALTFREAYPEDEGTDMKKSLQLYRTIASASLAGCAGVYLLGGLVCMGALRRARQKREDRLSEAATEFDELERRRRELQRLLGRPAEP